MDYSSGGGSFWVEAIITAVILLYPMWRIFSRAGLAAPLSLIVLVPGLGSLICVAILAFSRWPSTEGQG